MEIACKESKVKKVVVPTDWKTISLIEVATVIMGQSPAGRSYNKQGNGVPLVNGPTEFTDNYPIKLQWTTEPTKYCHSGDLLVCVRGSSTGRINISNDEYCIGRGVAAIRAKDCYDNQYIIAQIQNAVSGILSLTEGSTFPNLDGKTIRSIPIPLPPTKTEQNAIATILSDTDALIQGLEKLIAKKRAIKQGTMQELLTGKRRLPGFEGKGQMHDSEVGIIPADWMVVRMGEIGQSFIGLTYSPNDVVENGTLVLRSSNIQNNVLAYEDNVFVSIQLPERVIVHKDDILICVRNGSRQLIGKCALIDSTAEGSAFGAFMSLYRSTHSHFVFRQFQSAIIQHQINETLGATINQITNKDMASFLVCLPSNPQEEKAIVGVLSSMEKELASLESKLDKYRTIKQGMMQELLTGRIRLVNDPIEITEEKSLV